jgi:hypothetical protein
MGVWEDYAARLEKDIADFKRDLKSLESGELRHAERIGGGQWVDTTQREIDWHKTTIARFETMLAATKKRLGE